MRLDGSSPRPWPATSVVGLLSETPRADLLSLGVRREFAAGQVLLHQGERSTHVFVLLTGHVKILSESGSGRTILLAVRSRGDLVGELAGMDGSSRMARVVAIRAIAAQLLPFDEFEGFLHRHPEALRVVNASIAAKLRSATDKIIDFSSQEVPVRVARALLRILADHGTPAEGGGTSIGIPLTQPELAAIVSASEPAVHKALAELRKHEVISVGYRSYVVRDLPRLRDFAELPPEIMAKP
ncbi:Crp/Fnr family transcriptional regulator [Marinactinospora thermotolerans]|uniref:cAMP-binding domain of CRP or a regulatory subunit of cAMP-dependent protein kinases n=1 Tax=Marinactinospora thermotolerans DSM 45154 TaxID=1122192 RepID=A0A1T4LCD2_9ACTN|nr:Crp/Fnr family transcriptional regulator [Marinactinospora thermotolerans]SJZ52208.1 cAMP-binding domain of CRP or a regulatory subunit of cAMP-dependent protein kinases [Marinactinospora thermotolerans DSM 45154]